MNRRTQAPLLLMILLVISACALWAPATANPVADIPAVRLTVNTQNAVSTFSKVGDVINYNYVVANTGTSPLRGPVTITDAPRQAACPALTSLGNLDDFLDTTESVTCTASYTITDADFNVGSVINVATATVGGLISNQAGVTLTRSTGTPQPSAVLTLSKTADPQTYSQVGQTITYTFVITNAGTVPLGPDQFKITDSKLGATFNCGPDATTIAPSQSLSCSVPYLITQADITAANITNTATASGAGHMSAAATTTVTNFTITQAAATTQAITPSVAENLTPGTTIQHQVAVGEWLWQIVRCYGATFSEVRNANRQITDPNFILPSMIVTVPRIGSAGQIYGRPCVVFHTVQSSDTWASIAQLYNADIGILQLVNSRTLTVGTAIKVPRNSAGSVSVTAAPTIGVTATSTPTTGVPATSAPTNTVAPTTGAAPTAAQRITFESGKTTTSIFSVVNPNQTIQFVLNAVQGQTLSIQLSTPDNGVAMAVTGPTGAVLKASDASPTWSTPITTSGDHYINITSLVATPNKSYTLTVSLNSPGVTPAVTPTVTSTVAPNQ